MLFRSYIAAHSTGDSPWITPLTAAEKKAFKEAYPDEPRVKSWIQLEGTSRKLYLGFDPPLSDALMFIVR